MAEEEKNDKTTEVDSSISNGMKKNIMQVMDKDTVSEAQKARENELAEINDIPVKVTAVLGSSKIMIEDLMDLKKGSIVELDKKVGEQVDIFVNNHLVAHGEVVINEGKLGISLTEIIKLQD